jgi:hypothetical protein
VPELEQTFYGFTQDFFTEVSLGGKLGIGADGTDFASCCRQLYQ